MVNLKLKWTSILLVIALLTAIGIVAIQTATNDRHIAETKSAEAPSASDINVTETKPGWWETRQLIYYNIPARVLFKLPDKKRAEAEYIAAQAWQQFDGIGNIFNPSDPGSEVNRLNASDTTEPVVVSENLLTVMALSRRLWRQSDGAFDPTMQPIKTLWQKAVEIQEIPSERELLNARRKVGFGHIRLMPDTHQVISDIRGIRFDFGGIAKGFAVDEVRALLHAAGVRNGLVQLGGEIAAFGENDGRPWRIGIQHPIDMNAVWGVISAAGSTRVSTSGNYRQPLVIQGHTFYHIFSPKTGRPVPEKVLGVTTVSLTADHSNALLDGAATAITVMGRQDGLSFAEKLGIQALVLTRNPDGTIEEHGTSGLSDYYRPETKME